MEEDQYEELKETPSEAQLSTGFQNQPLNQGQEQNQPQNQPQNQTQNQENKTEDQGQPANKNISYNNNTNTVEYGDLNNWKPENLSKAYTRILSKKERKTRKTRKTRKNRKQKNRKTRSRK